MTRRASDPKPSLDGPPVATKPPRRAPPRIGARVAPQIARLAAKSGAMDPALAANWEAAAGADLAVLCRPVRLRRQKNAVALEVAVRSGAAAMRLQYAQEQLLARLRTHLREPRLTRLLIKQAGAAPEAPRWASRRVTAPQDEEVPAPVRRPAASLAEALERMRRDMNAPER